MIPDRDAIDGFVDFTGVHQSIAAEWLQLHGNDVEKATNAFFDDPGLLDRRKRDNIYDERQFHSDPTGQQPLIPPLRHGRLLE
ncbi:MAG: hypothetical protein Q9213_007116 [Squamulea squamosa]